MHFIFIQLLHPVVLPVQLCYCLWQACTIMGAWGPCHAGLTGS